MTQPHQPNGLDMLMRYWPAIIVLVGGLLTAGIANYRIGIAERDLLRIQAAQETTNTALNQLSIQLAVQNGDIRLILSMLNANPQGRPVIRPTEQ